MYLKEAYDDNFQNPQSWGVDPYDYDNEPEWVKQGAFAAGQEAADMLGNKKTGRATYIVDIRPLMRHIGVTGLKSKQEFYDALTKLKELGNNYNVDIDVHLDNLQLALVKGKSSDIRNMLSSLNIGKDKYSMYDAGDDYVIYAATPLGCIRAYFYGQENDVFTSAKEAERFYAEFKDSMEDHNLIIDRVNANGDEQIAICGPRSDIEDFIDCWESYLTDIEEVDESKYKYDDDDDYTESMNEAEEIEYNWIKLNSVPTYPQVADKWEVEDKGFMPKIRNAETGKVISWSMSGNSFRTAYVTKKDGGRTSISSEVLSKGMDELHNDPFFRKEQRDKRFKRR